MRVIGPKEFTLASKYKVLQNEVALMGHHFLNEYVGPNSRNEFGFHGWACRYFSFQRIFLGHGVCWSWMMMVAHPKPHSQYSHFRLPQEEMEWNPNELACHQACAKSTEEEQPVDSSSYQSPAAKAKSKFLATTKSLCALYVYHSRNFQISLYICQPTRKALQLELWELHVK